MSNAKDEAKKLIDAYPELVKSHETRIASLKSEIEAGAPNQHLWFLIACMVLLGFQTFVWSHMYLKNLPVVSVSHAVNLLCWCYLVYRLVRCLQEGPRRLWRTARSRQAQVDYREARLAYVDALRDYQVRLAAFQRRLFEELRQAAEEARDAYAEQMIRRAEQALN